MKSLLALPTAFAILLVGFDPSTADEVRVGTTVIEGDPSLLARVRSAQLTQPSLFDRGSLTAKVHLDMNGDVTDADVSMIWQGANVYWKCDEAPSPTEDLVDRPLLSGRLELIRRGDLTLFYQPSAYYLESIRGDGPTLPDYTNLLPETWFMLEGLVKWADFLPPGSPGLQERMQLSKCVVLPGADDTVNIELHYPSGDTFMITASNQFGGNIVSYESQPKSGDTRVSRAGSYKWAQDGHGKWYPQRYEHSRSIETGDNQTERSLIVDISSFNSAPSIPNDRFTIASLRLPPGTKVQETEDSKVVREYQIGERSITASLEEMSRVLRGRGFASPSRAR